MEMTRGSLGRGCAETVTRRRRTAPLVILVIALAALWPALVNGGPFYHPDTPSYFRGVASAAYKAFGVKTDWAQEYIRVYQAPAIASSSATPAQQVRPELPVTLTGRSIYYGALLILAHLAGSIWIVVIVQSLLAAASIVFTIDLIGRASNRSVHPATALIAGLIAAAATPLGYETGKLMPGIFTGIGLLAEANLLFLWTWQSRREKAFWIAMLAYATLAHSTNLMLAAALLVLALAYGRWRRFTYDRAQLASVVGCIAIGVLGQAAFSFAVTKSTGAAPVRPPFVAMRLIEDGPGYAYLQHHCARERYIYCQVLRENHRNSDDLLWSEDPRISLFRGLTPDEQRVSASQQQSFVFAVFAERPLEVMATAARNSWTQLLSLDLVNFNYSEGNRKRFQKTVPPALLASMQSTRAFQDRMPVRLVEISDALLSIFSALCMVFFLVRSRHTPSENMRAYCL